MMDGKKLRGVLQKIGNAISGSAPARLLTSGDVVNEKLARSVLLTGLSRSAAARWLRALRLSVAVKIEKKSVFAPFYTVVRGLLDASARVYGTYFITFALYTAAVFSTRLFALDMYDVRSEDPIIAGFMLLAGLMLMMSDRPVAELLRSSFFGRWFLVRVIGVRPVVMKSVKRSGGAWVAFMLGTVCGLLTAVCSPLFVLLWVVIAVFGILVLCAPECGVTLSLMAMPFLEDWQIGCVICFVLAGYLLKVLRFKRNFTLRAADILLLIFSAAIFISGIMAPSVVSGLSAASELLCGLACYFLAVNLIRSDKLVYCCMRSLQLGAVTYSVFALVLIFAPRFIGAEVIPSRLYDLVMPDRVPWVVLTAAVVLLVRQTVTENNFFRGLRSLICLAAVAVTLVKLAGPPAWVGALTGLALFCCCMSVFWLPVFAASAAAYPLWGRWTESWRLRLELAEFFYGQSATVRAEADSMLFLAGFSDKVAGAGLGDASMTITAGVPLGTAGGTWHTLFAQCGILLTALLAIALLLIIIRVLTGVRMCPKHTGRPIVASVAAGAVTVFVGGFFTDIFFDLSESAVFWFMCGLMCAAVDNFAQDREIMLQQE